jgi:hypothetical protein
VPTSDSGNEEEITPVNVGKRKKQPVKRNPRAAARQRTFDEQQKKVLELQDQMVQMTKKFEASQQSLKLASAKKTVNKITGTRQPKGNKQASIQKKQKKQAPGKKTAAEESDGENVSDDDDKSSSSGNSSSSSSSSSSSDSEKNKKTTPQKKAKISTPSKDRTSNPSTPQSAAKKLTPKPKVSSILIVGMISNQNGTYLLF